MFNFLKYTKIYYFFSLLLAILALISIFKFGLNFGVDFKGGSILELDFEKRPDNSVIQEKLGQFNLGELTIQPTGERGVILRLKEIDEETHQKIISALNEISKTEEKRFESIGPVVGKELRQKTILLISFSTLVLLLFIAISFNQVSGWISPWQYGLVSLLSLCFDVLIPTGLLAYLGKFYNVQFTIPIITALLTILGYTTNDKITIFDRIRENLLKRRGENFTDLVNRSLNEILIRSLSTGACALLVLTAIFFFGGESLKYFSLTLIVGILVGTYSSLFLASPLLVSWTKIKKKGLTGSEKKFKMK